MPCCGSREPTQEYSLADVTWMSESEDLPVIIRSPTLNDRFFLSRMPEAMRGVFGIPHKSNSVEIVKAWQREHDTILMVQDGNAMEGPKRYNLFITNHEMVVYGMCGYSDIVNERSLGGRSRGADLLFWVDEDVPRIKEKTEGALKLLLEFGITDASDGGLQLDRMRVLAREDQKVGLHIITNKLSLPLGEAFMEDGPGSSAGQGKWYAWELTKEEALRRLPKSVRSRD